MRDGMAPDEVSAAFAAAVLRLNDRYLGEIVEAFDICPFARGSRSQGKVARRILGQRDASLEPALAAIRELEADATRPEIGLLIFPRLRARLPPRRWDDFVEEVRRASAAQGLGAFAAAAFHPDYPVDVQSPARLVPALRRSPDPTIQLVRYETLEAVRAGAPEGTFLFDYSAEAFAALAKRLEREPLADRIAAANHATFGGTDLDRLEERLRDIMADRRETYAAFGETDGAEG